MDQVCAKGTRRVGPVTGLAVFLASALMIVSCNQSGGRGGTGSQTVHQNQATTLPASGEIDDRHSAGLIGSPHDFTLKDDRSLDLCTPCHAPHLPLPKGVRPEGDRDEGPLSSYSSAGVALDSASLVCLSCHDGVIATDVYTASHATRFAAQFGNARSGTGLTAGHPIGIAYPTSERTYRSMSAVLSSGTVKLPGGRVQCISCHDPHNTGRHPGMLVQTNSGSRLCLSCHRL